MTDAASKPEGITPSATVGPYFKYGLTSHGDYPWNDAFHANIATPDAQGERIRIAGELHDGVMQEMLAATMMLGSAKRRTPGARNAYTASSMAHRSSRRSRRAR